MYFEEYSYIKIWQGLSNNDKIVIKVIIKTKNGEVKEIMNICNMDNNHFNPYRKRLINKGLVDGKERGILKITLPLFDEFVEDNYFDD